MGLSWQQQSRFGLLYIQREATMRSCLQQPRPLEATVVFRVRTIHSAAEEHLDFFTSTLAVHIRIVRIAKVRSLP